jgi:hypothetical protein
MGRILAYLLSCKTQESRLRFLGSRDRKKTKLRPKRSNKIIASSYVARFLTVLFCVIGRGGSVIFSARRQLAASDFDVPLLPNKVERSTIH